MSLVYPVIHFLNHTTALAMADMAFTAGADGVFLISHGQADPILPSVARDVKLLHPGKFVGINLLSLRADQAFEDAADAGLDGLWSDNPGVDSAGLSEMGTALQLMARDAEAAKRKVEIFASVAFKYRRIEADPAGAAAEAAAAGMIATTSGEGTGQAPTISKIVNMSRAVKGRLAVASGMTPENVDIYAPYLSHILVATGVSVDEHHFDPTRLRDFVQIAHGALPADFDDLATPFEGQAS